MPRAESFALVPGVSFVEGAGIDAPVGAGFGVALTSPPGFEGSPSALPRALSAAGDGFDRGVAEGAGRAEGRGDAEGSRGAEGVANGKARGVGADDAAFSPATLPIPDLICVAEAVGAGVAETWVLAGTLAVAVAVGVVVGDRTAGHGTETGAWSRMVNFDA